MHLMIYLAAPTPLVNSDLDSDLGRTLQRQHCLHWRQDGAVDLLAVGVKPQILLVLAGEAVATLFRDPTHPLVAAHTSWTNNSVCTTRRLNDNSTCKCCNVRVRCRPCCTSSSLSRRNNSLETISMLWLRYLPNSRPNSDNFRCVFSSSSLLGFTLKPFLHLAAPRSLGEAWVWHNLRALGQQQSSLQPRKTTLI